MSNSGVAPLHDAARNVSGQDDGDINTEGNSGVTPLHDAARNESGQVDGDINTMSYSGVTPLHDAAFVRLTAKVFTQSNFWYFYVSRNTKNY